MEEDNQHPETIEDYKKALHDAELEIHGLEHVLEDFQKSHDMYEKFKVYDNKEKEDLKVNIAELKEKIEDLNNIILERDETIEELKKIRDSVIQPVESMVDTVAEFIDKSTEMRTEVKNLHAVLNDNQATTLTEVRKIAVEQKNDILFEIARQPEIMRAMIKEEVAASIKAINLDSVIEKVNVRIDEKVAEIEKEIDNLPDVLPDRELIMDLPDEILRMIQKTAQPKTSAIPTPTPTASSTPSPVKVDMHVSAQSNSTDKISGLNGTLRQVYDSLTCPKTKKEMMEGTGMPRSTIDRKVKELQKRELIKSDHGYPEKFYRV